MFNLYQIMQTAQSGQAIANLAQASGLTPDETSRGINALIPALAAAFMAKAAMPGGYAALVTEMGDPQHRLAYDEAAAALDPATLQKGRAIIASLFGTPDMTAKVVEQASRFSSVPEAVLSIFLPVVASILMGGTAAALKNQGPGAFPGFAAPGAMPGPFPSGGFPLGGFPSGGFPSGGFPAGGFASAGFPPPGMGPGGFPAAGFPMSTMPGAAATVPPALKAGLEAWAKMFQPGGPGKS